MCIRDRLEWGADSSANPGAARSGQVGTRDTWVSSPSDADCACGFRSQFADHPGVLPLLDSAVVPLVNNHSDDEHFEVYLLFPVFKDGDLMEYLNKGTKNTRCFTSVQALRIFDQVANLLDHSTICVLTVLSKPIER
eukprot:3732692-Pyramimonas_sp.AAC.2